LSLDFLMQARQCIPTYGGPAMARASAMERAAEPDPAQDLARALERAEALAGVPTGWAARSTLLRC
jgi:hypothetical protein